MAIDLATMKKILTVTAFTLAIVCTPAFCQAPEALDLKQIQGRLEDGANPLSKSEKTAILARLNAILQGVPKSANALYLKGVTQFELGDYAAALESLNLCLEQDPHNIPALEYRAIIKTFSFAGSGRSSEALADYNAAIALGDKHARVFSNRGSLYQQLNEHEKAVADFDQAIDAKPQDQSAIFSHLMRANSLVQLKAYERAIADSDFVLTQKLPAVVLAQAHHTKARALFAQGRYKEAIDELTAAINDTTDSKSRGAMIYLRGAAHHRLGEKGCAEADLKLAQECGFALHKGPPDRVAAADRELAEALKPLIEQARKTLPDVKERYLKGLPAGCRLSVTTQIHGPEGAEQVFVSVDRWVGDLIDGRLLNDVKLSNHKRGEQLQVKESDVLDWTILDGAGKEEGNLLGKYIDDWLDKRKADSERKN